MGTCMSAENKEERTRSYQIDRQIEQDAKNLKRECKILLLGGDWFFYYPRVFLLLRANAVFLLFQDQESRGNLPLWSRWRSFIRMGTHVMNSYFKGSPSIRIWSIRPKPLSLPSENLKSRWTVILQRYVHSWWAVWLGPNWHTSPERFGCSVGLQNWSSSFFCSGSTDYRNHSDFMERSRCRAVTG